MTAMPKIWKYTYEHDNKNDPFINIEAPDGLKRELPKTLFKYYSLNELSLNVLRNLEIYGSDSFAMNDVFEAHESLIELNSDLRNDLLKLHNELSNSKNNIDDDDLNMFLQSIMLKFFGIFSLSSTPNSQLMWTHYSQNNGFCVEFDYEQLLYDNLAFGPFQVNYIKDNPKFEPISLNEAFLYLSHTKSTTWDYEEEWRMFLFKPIDMRIDSFESLKNPSLANRLFKIKKNSIIKILLGPKFINRFSDKIVFDSKEKTMSCKFGHRIHLKKDKDKEVITRKLELMEIIHLNNFNFSAILPENAFNLRPIKKLEIIDIDTTKHFVKFKFFE
jgi:hypothetical protein